MLLLNRIVSRLFCSDSRYVFFSTSAACSSACSTVPKSLDDLHRTFVADAGRSGNIVDGVAPQRHHVHDPLRRHAQNFLHLRRIADQVVLRRIQNLHFVVDQLHHVFVAGNDIHRMRRLGRLARQSADHVVGLEAHHLQDRNAVRLERPPDIRNLLHQVFRHGRAVGLVPLVFHFRESLRLDVELANAGHGLRLLVAKSRSGHVEHRRQILGRKIVAQFAQHVHEDVNRRRRKPGLSRHGPLPRHGVIGAEDE